MNPGEYLIRLSAREDYLVSIEAARTGRTRDQTVAALISAAADALPGPEPGPRHVEQRRETQTEKRARLRAASPDGMSPYTRELQTIRPSKETTP